MGSYRAYTPAVATGWNRGAQPSIVVGITNAQTCLVLRGRLRALRESGFDVTLISSPGELLDRTAAEEGVDSIAIPMKRGIAPFSDFVSLFRIWRVLRRLRPDISEFSTPKAGLLGNLAALLSAVPHRVYFLRGLRLETAVGWQRPLLRFAEQIAAACSHTVLCNSSSLRQRARALAMAPGRLCLLGHGSSMGVDVERFSPGPDTNFPESIRHSLGLPPHAPVVGYVGRLTRDKGIPELLQAFEQILVKAPEAWLLLVGWFDASEDALPQAMRARIVAHPRIVYTGFVADAAPHYRAMDLLVLPTWREGFPNVVLEASASGLAVVTTTATGARDAVVPGVTGILVSPGDAAAIAETVVRLLCLPEERQRMGVAGRRWVTERFRQQHVIDLTTAMYRACLRKDAAGRVPLLATDAAAAAD